ncbi:phosphate-starvation-inducible PsiE family protein [Planotetraspora mira]|nr:phosphate-starvation-inducible PsiE family protein [Planotetraspora mira]
MAGRGIGGAAILHGIPAARASKESGEAMEGGQLPRGRRGSRVAEIMRNGSEQKMLRFLVWTERVVLYLVSLMLLVVAAAVIVFMWITVAQSSGSWTTKTIIVIEELLLVLIILEIFVTVLAHLEGGRLQLEPFIIVGVIAVVRHILSVVVRLAVSMTAAESRAQWIELAVYAGVAFLLVAALAVARWSQRVADQEPSVGRGTDRRPGIGGRPPSAE